MDHHLFIALGILSIMISACSPPDSDEPAPEMKQPVVDMAQDSAPDAEQPSEDMEEGNDLDVQDAQDLAADLTTAEECVEGAERAPVGEEICRDGVLYVCNKRLIFFSLERTCTEVPVDIQFTQISARATSEMTNVYRIETLYTITNLGTDTALNVMCESQIDDEQGVSGWVDDIGFDTFILEPGEEHVIDGGFTKGMGSGVRMGTFRARCSASNEDEVAKTLRNEASTTYTY